VYLNKLFIIVAVPYLMAISNFFKEGMPKVTNKEKAVVKKQKDVVCMLHSTYDTLCIVHILSTIYCIVHTLYYILCTVYYILCTVYYILCTAYCFILYNTSIYYTLHTI